MACDRWCNCADPTRGSAARKRMRVHTRRGSGTRARRLPHPGAVDAVRWTHPHSCAVSTILMGATGLLPQEPRELWPSFPQDPALCRAPFWHEPALLSHGKRSPPAFLSKNVGVTKSPFPPGNVTFFRRKNADFTARAVRFLEKNGGLVV